MPRTLRGPKPRPRAREKVEQGGDNSHELVLADVRQKRLEQALVRQVELWAVAGVHVVNLHHVAGAVASLRGEMPKAAVAIGRAGEQVEDDACAHDGRIST